MFNIFKTPHPNYLLMNNVHVTQNSFQLNCWFCHKLCGAICLNDNCLKSFVNYSINDNDALAKIQFAYKTNSKEYVVNYLPISKIMEIFEYIKHQDESYFNVDYSLKKIFSTPYDALILTPNNAKDKLLALIALS